MRCLDCKYYLPSDATFYNKPTGYCAHPMRGKPVKGLSEKCARFEQMQGVSVMRSVKKTKNA